LTDKDARIINAAVQCYTVSR